MPENEKPPAMRVDIYCCPKKNGGVFIICLHFKPNLSSIVRTDKALFL